jgi:hypothetical protein
MFAGHIGAALAIGRAERRVNVGLFIAAALMLDFLLWLFVLAGWESVAIPADFADTHQAEFVFPYSHGLLASIVWSAVAGLIGSAFCSQPRTKWRIGALLALAVLSHWVLDAMVHRRELPLAGPASPAMGLGLWNHLPLALLLEAAIVVVGVFLFVSGVGRRKPTALVLLTVVAMVFTAMGMTVAPAPPSAKAMASGSLATLVFVCALAGWCGRASQGGEPAGTVTRSGGRGPRR